MKLYRAIADMVTEATPPTFSHHAIGQATLAWNPVGFYYLRVRIADEIKVDFVDRDVYKTWYHNMASFSLAPGDDVLPSWIIDFADPECLEKTIALIRSILKSGPIV